MAFKMNNPLKHMGYKVDIKKGKVVSEEEKPHKDFKEDTQHEEYHDQYPSKPFTDAEGRPLKKFKLNPAYPSRDGQKPHSYPYSPDKEPLIETEFEVIKVELGDGIAGEANNDGTIFVDENIEDGSIEEAEVVAHEGKHMKDMESGLLAYTDDHIEYKGKKYERKDGKIKYNGKWRDEGWKQFPWEKTAYKEGDAAVKQLKKQYGE